MGGRLTGMLLRLLQHAKATCLPLHAAHHAIAFAVMFSLSAAPLTPRTAAAAEPRGSMLCASGPVHLAAAECTDTRVVSGVAFYYQDHPLSCEEASMSMALTHQGIALSQDQILSELGADSRPMYVDQAGRVHWGNPYETFVGNVDGNESDYTGFGTYYPPLVRVAKAHGARILAYGSMSALTIYSACWQDTQSSRSPRGIGSGTRATTTSASTGGRFHGSARSTPRTCTSSLES